MWPIVMALLRRNVVYVTLPFACVIGKPQFNVLCSDFIKPASIAGLCNDFFCIIFLQDLWATTLKTSCRINIRRILVSQKYEQTRLQT